MRAITLRRTARLFASLLAVPAIVAAQTTADRTQDRVAFPAHNIVGNVSYVGTATLNSYLITTPQGHILINTNFEDTVPLLRESIEKLGFKMTDIKIILGSHAHPDHMQGDAVVKELTGGATVMAMEQDVPALKAMKGPSGKAHPIDRVLKDGRAGHFGRDDTGRPSDARAHSRVHDLDDGDLVWRADLRSAGCVRGSPRRTRAWSTTRTTRRLQRTSQRASRRSGCYRPTSFLAPTAGSSIWLESTKDSAALPIHISMLAVTRHGSTTRRRLSTRCSLPRRRSRPLTDSPDRAGGACLTFDSVGA